MVIQGYIAIKNRKFRRCAVNIQRFRFKPLNYNLQGIYSLAEDMAEKVIDKKL